MFLILETFNPEQTDTSMTNNEEVTGLSSACDHSTQTENVLDMTKEHFEDDVFKEQEITFPCQYQNQTEV